MTCFIKGLVILNEQDADVNGLSAHTIHLFIGRNVCLKPFRNEMVINDGGHQNLMIRWSLLFGRTYANKTKPKSINYMLIKSL